MSLLGADGFREIGDEILSRTQYAISVISKIEGLRAPYFRFPHFKEFTLNFDETSKAVAEVNKRLLKMGIFGGRSLISEFPELGQTALYCVTESNSLDEIDRLGECLKEIMRC